VLPVVFSAAWPTLKLAPMLKTFRTNGFTKTGYLLCSVTIAIHMLDYAYAADKPELMFPGYLIALIMTTGLSCFSFAVLIERAIIEVEMKDLLHNTSRLTALGGMAAEIAHEINNPLTVISLNNQQIKHKLQQSNYDPEFMLGKIEVADRMINRLTKIMQALKSSYRSTDQDTFKQVSLHDLLDDIQFLCQIRTERMGVSLTIEKRTEQILLECRPTQISQVLQNLIYNALDAVEGCEQKWVKVSYAVKNYENLEIYIADSGVGIPEHLRGRIFDNLFTTKPNGAGTGLGLSISKRFVEEHGGFLKISPSLEQTTFVIELPLKQSNLAQTGFKTAAS
jgi:C4-dicarboxylate-specific signal transduction histidine kinase